MEKLFSYGTLQYENVQLATFGRRLIGSADVLPGYCLSTLRITNPDVVNKSGEEVHSVVVHTGNPKDKVPGMVFEVSLSEIQEADKYESADYKRIQIKLHSGLSAWVYVRKND